MQNIINTIKYRVITALFVVASMAILVVPTAVMADEGSSYDYYPSSNYAADSSYDYYPSSNYSSGSSYDYYPSSNYAADSSYDYYPSSNYGYDTGYDYYPSSNYGYSDSYSQPYSTGYSSPSYGYSSYGYPQSSSYGYSSGYVMPYSYGGIGGGYSGYNNGGGYGGNSSLSFLSNKTNTNYNYTSTVTNTNNTCAGQGNCNVVTNQVAQNTNTLEGSCTASGSYGTNQTVTWTANATGGNGGYTYSWSGDAYGNGSSVSNTYYNGGTKSATVTITSNGQSITRNCSTQVNNNYNQSLSGYCSASVSGNNVATFTANANGGNGSNYNYQWSGDVYGNGSVVTQSFSTSGTKSATVRITDGGGQSVTQTCNVYVGGNNGNITLVSNGGNTPNNGTLASGVYLSDIPYTGVGENLKMILFVLGMTLWSAFMAWVFLKKKAAKLGMTQREMIAKFKRDNLARKGIIA